MALSMLDKKGVRTDHAAWPADITAEFERERKSPNGCVGQRLMSESERVRVWSIRLKPGERFGFHRHVLDYFWSALNAGRARAHRRVRLMPVRQREEASAPAFSSLAT